MEILVIKPTIGRKSIRAAVENLIRSLNEK